MIVTSWQDFLGGKGPSGALAATIGVFDGLHIGHRRLIDRVFANSEGRESGVITFRENPKGVVRPSSFRGSLSSLEGKLESLDALGLDLCVLIDFSGDFSKLSGRDFLSLLHEKGRLEYIAIGSNFSCGHKLDTDANDIAGFYAVRAVHAEILEPVQWEGYAVSSSRIRVAIMDGRLEDAAQMLGRPYGLDLAGFPTMDSRAGFTAYRRSSVFVLPPPGDYEVEVESKKGRVPTRLNISEEGLLLAAAKDDAPRTVSFIGLTKAMKRLKE